MILPPPIPRGGDLLRLLALALLLAVALVALPGDDLATRNAAAVVCDVDDVACHERQARCWVRSVVEGGACPR